MFSNVDDSRPPRTTTAIGLCISLPDAEPFMIIGTNANADVKAVIRIGVRRSSEPCITASSSGIPSPRRCW